MLVLPIALPGIVTGLALQSAFNISHIELSIYTIIVGHANLLHGRRLQQRRRATAPHLHLTA